MYFSFQVTKDLMRRTYMYALRHQDILDGDIIMDNLLFTYSLLKDLICVVETHEVCKHFY